MTRKYMPVREGNPSLIQKVVVSYPLVPKAGDIVRCGDMIGYALQDEDADGYTVVDFGEREVRGIVLGGGIDLAAGSKVYFDDMAANPITGDSSGNIFCGYVLGVVDDSGNATVNILKTAI